MLYYKILYMNYLVPVEGINANIYKENQTLKICNLKTDKKIRNNETKISIKLNKTFKQIVQQAKSEDYKYIKFESKYPIKKLNENIYQIYKNTLMKHGFQFEQNTEKDTTIAIREI